MASAFTEGDTGRWGWRGEGRGGRGRAPAVSVGQGVWLWAWLQGRVWSLFSHVLDRHTPP